MRRLLLVVVVCLCASLAVAQGKTANGWTCPKPTDAHAIEIGDKPGHAFSIDQITCTSTKGEIAGVREKEGTGTEFAEVTGNSMKGHGVFVETMANGDKLHFVYQFTATTKDGKMQSGSNKWQSTSGAGKFTGLKANSTSTPSGKETDAVNS